MLNVRRAYKTRGSNGVRGVAVMLKRCEEPRCARVRMRRQDRRERRCAVQRARLQKIA